MPWGRYLQVLLTTVVATGVILILGSFTIAESVLLPVQPANATSTPPAASPHRLTTTPLPWVVLTARVGGFDGRVGPRDCLALRVAPTAAVTSSRCLATAFDQTPSMVAAAVLTGQVSLDETHSGHKVDDAGVDVGDVVVYASNGVRRHWRLVSGANVLPQVAAAAPESTTQGQAVALVTWSDPVVASAIPAVVVDHHDTAVHEDGAVVSVLVADEDFESTAVSPPQPPEDHGNGCRTEGTSTCVDVAWAAPEQCRTVASVTQSGFYVGRGRQGQRTLRGLVAWSTSACAGDSLHGRVVPIAASLEFMSDVVNKRDEVSLNSSHSRVTEAPTSSPESVPPVGSRSSDRSSLSDISASSGGSSSNETGDDDLPPDVPLRVWLQDLSQGAVLTPGLETPSSMTEASSVGGVIAVVIAPKFLLISLPSSSRRQVWKYAHFATETIAIISTTMQESSNSRFDGERLVVVEIATDAPCLPFHILSSAPQKYRVISSLLLLLYVEMDQDESNPGVGRQLSELRFGDFVLSDAAECAAGDDNDFLCFKTVETLAKQLPSLFPMNSTIVVDGDGILGVSARPSTTKSDYGVTQRFHRLGSLVNREFLDRVTKKTIVWNDDGGWSQPDSAILPQMPVMYLNDSAMTVLDCPSIAISPSELIAPASCLDGRRPYYASWASNAMNDSGSECVFEFLSESSGDEDAGSKNGACLYAVVDSVVTHPGYRIGQRGQNDIAVIVLKQRLRRLSVLQLYPMDLPNRAPVVEISTWNHSEVYTIVTKQLDTCSGTHSLVCTVPNKYYCHIGESSYGRFLLFVQGASTYFVGFAVGMCHQYQPVYAYMNFINAVATGQCWHEDPMFGYFAPKYPEPIVKDYVVGLRMTKDGQNFCGGSLIAPQYVLTAAHCVSDGIVKWVSIGSTASAGPSVESIPIVAARIRVHPNYQSPHRFSHDIAILELQVPAYSSYIGLDGTADFVDDDPARMFGYGLSGPTSEQLSPVVHSRLLTLLSKPSCVKTIPDVDESTLCALATDGFDACKGDSGGPLVVTDSRGVDHLIGLVSAGYGCGVVGVPGLYTRIGNPKIVDFINAYVITPKWVNVPATSSPTRSPSTPFPGSFTTHVDDGTNSTQRSGSVGPDGALEERSSKPQSSNTASDKGPRDSGHSYDSAILTVRVSGLSSFTMQKLLAFLLGEYPASPLPTAQLDALLLPTNQVSLSTSASTKEMINLLNKYNARPLNQRRERFHTTGSTRRPVHSSALEC